MSNDSAAYRYLVLDSWSYRFQTEPVLGEYQTRAEAEAKAKCMNRDTVKPRYTVFAMGDEGQCEQLQP
jgi:hypothetical protein